MSRIIEGNFASTTEIEAELEISVFSDVCSRCVHFNRANAIDRQCTAFPNGIPLKIWNAEINHTESYPGDNGIQFEPILKKAA